MKKFFLTILTLLICLCAFGGCTDKSDSLIPNGIYGGTGTENYYVLSQGSGGEHYWKIKGNKAERHTSGYTDFKCNIIKESGDIYFEGYTWKTALSSKEYGKVFKCKVDYNEELQSITIFWE